MMSTCARNMYRHEIKLIVKQILCISLVKYWDKYTKMHGQQNVKIVEQISNYEKSSIRLSVWAKKLILIQLLPLYQIKVASTEVGIYVHNWRLCVANYICCLSHAFPTETFKIPALYISVSSVFASLVCVALDITYSSDLMQPIW